MCRTPRSGTNFKKFRFLFMNICNHLQLHLKTLVSNVPDLSQALEIVWNGADQPKAEKHDNGDINKPSGIVILNHTSIYVCMHCMYEEK